MLINQNLDKLMQSQAVRWFLVNSIPGLLYYIFQIIHLQRQQQSIRNILLLFWQAQTRKSKCP